jgi:predicted CoA-binding protein
MTDDDIHAQIQTFLAAGPFAVVGASNDRTKYGAKVLLAYRQQGLRAYPVNPRATEVLGEPAFPDLTSLPEPVSAISIITPPTVTEQVVEEAGMTGVQHIWMQPGAESARAVERARELGMSVIAGGPCLLVAVGYRE